mmetsp:Transcript_91439/g.217886  ORF Transcript_91439/g.217886 Transcript_91439/m.217886 type:complete len:209 (-) Transcript_91439:1346-1972(-)
MEASRKMMLSLSSADFAAIMDSMSAGCKGRTSTARLRRAFCASFSLCRWSMLRSVAVIGSPGTSNAPAESFASVPALSNSLSGAPFRIATCVHEAGNLRLARRLAGRRWTVAIIFRLELKGTSRSGSRACSSKASPSWRPALAAATFNAPSVMLPEISQEPVSDCHKLVLWQVRKAQARCACAMSPSRPAVAAFSELATSGKPGAEKS